MNNELKTLKDRGFSKIKEGTRKGTLVVPFLTNLQKDLLTVTASKSDLVAGKAKSYTLYSKDDLGEYQIPYFLCKDFVRKIYDIKRKFPHTETEPKLISSYRYGQKKIVDDVIYGLTSDRGVTLNAPPATGKTFISIAVAIELKLFPMIVLVHRKDLANQWKREFDNHSSGITSKVLTSSSPATVGCDVIITTGQYLSRQDHVPNAFKLLVVDEAHRFTTPMFLDSIKKLKFVYSIATTASKSRSDGLAWIYSAFIGDWVVTAESNNIMDSNITAHCNDYVGQENWEEAFRQVLCFNPAIKKDKKFKMVSKYRCTNCSQFKEDGCPYLVVPKNPRLDYNGMIKFLADQESLEQHVVDLATRDYMMGKNILLFVKNIDTAKKLEKRISAYGIEVGMYMRNAKEGQFRDYDFVILTYSKVDAGLDRKDLDTIYFYTPISQDNIHQLLGRIERIAPDKPTPQAHYFTDKRNKILVNMLKGCKNKIERLNVMNKRNREFKVEYEEI